MTAELTEVERQRVREDFQAWSGGFPPDSEEQVEVYVEYALPSDLDAEAVRHGLRTQVGAWQRGQNESLQRRSR
jgi:hypothetical protein